MAHFAKIENGIVVNVVVTDNEDPAGDEGHSWLVNTFGGEWVKTSFNTNAGVHSLGGEPFRKNFAEIGGTYDPVRDAFIPPKPHDSWTLDEETCTWQPPVPFPDGPGFHVWDEGNFTWKTFEPEVTDGDA